jgi:hypothetical protein
MKLDDYSGTRLFTPSKASKDAPPATFDESMLDDDDISQTCKAGQSGLAMLN